MNNQQKINVHVRLIRTWPSSCGHPLLTSHVSVLPYTVKVSVIDILFSRTSEWVGVLFCLFAFSFIPAHDFLHEFLSLVLC